MKIYKKLLRHGISLAPIGIETRNDEILYFCTPKGASNKKSNYNRTQIV